MSRQDPQFNLRIPSELKARVEEAAKENKRSATAEIIDRLKTSLALHPASIKGIPTADEARKIAAAVRQALPSVIRRRIEEELAYAIEMGHSMASVDLEDLGLDGGVSEEELAQITHDLDQELLAAGYKVEWDGGTNVTLFF